jgi:hypothetical protein
MIKPKHGDMTKNIWQVAAGDGGRDYSEDVFLRYGVMLIGPGSLGDYRKSKDKNTEEYKEYKKTAKKTTAQFIRRFYKAAVGELVVLKHGKKAIAVGKIQSEYDFKEVFSDVDGFDLRHCRRVEWTKLRRKKPIPSLTRARFCGVKKADDDVDRLWNKGKRKKSAKKIPPDPEKVSDKELVDSLAVKVWGRRNAKLIADAILRLRRLAEWYGENDEDYDVKEHEARTFLVVPLIMSLGWVEENVKIEWHNMDIVLFDRPYSQRSKPVVIIETKRLWHGLDASDQATNYAKKHRTCKKLVITDGIRYKLYTRAKRGKKWPLSAYLNLLTPTRKHPYDPDVGGAVSFLTKMFQRRQSNRRV